MKNFKLFQENILRLIREGRGEVSKEEWFYNAILEEINEISDQFKCKSTVNSLRLLQAQSYWDRDLLSLINNGSIENSSIPCHFKQSAFLCYWLRRRVVIEKIVPIKEEDELGPISHYLQYGNEVAAFLIGFRLCVYHEVIKPSVSGEDVLRRLEKMRLDFEYTKDVSILLHHKNVSPHSIYLIYKSLFYNLEMPPNEYGNIRLVHPK